MLRLSVRPAWFLPFLLWGCLSTHGSGQPLHGGWQKEYLGSDKEVPFYPDANANYWTYSFDVPDDGKLAIRIAGTYPDARYMSIQINNTATFSPIAGIADTAIAPDVGDGNTYRVVIIPDAGSSSDTGNVLRYPKNLKKIAVFLRYYLPRKSPTGGVKLPTLTAFDATNGKSLPLPRLGWWERRQERKKNTPVRGAIRRALRDAIVSGKVGFIFSLGRPPKLNAYRFSGAGLYPNRDNFYLAMPIQRKKDQVALIKFKAPRFAATAAARPAADVRYWSVSQGDAATYNHVTLADHQLKVSPDGFVRLVIADPGPAIEGVDATLNVMPWKTGEKMVLIFRQLLPRKDFAHAFSKVPEFSEKKKTTAQAAQTSIGSYAPIGVLLPRSAFLKRGFPEEF